MDLGIFDNERVNIKLELIRDTRLKQVTAGIMDINKFENYLNNSKVEFSKQLLVTCSDDTIRDVIMHEAAHYIANDRTHINHGHDAYFKAVCAEIGTTNDGTVTQTERTVAASEIYKYTVSCPNCGPLGYYHRMSKTLKNISHCSCRKCGSHDLSVIQNY
jgi:predicted SprT family Zn-dependent metalloprotease